MVGFRGRLRGLAATGAEGWVWSAIKEAHKEARPSDRTLRG